MNEELMKQTIERVRHFNRFYTRKIGVVKGDYLDSSFTLTEARIIYEIATHGQITGSMLSAELSLDAGYVSRLLSGLKQRGLLEIQRSQEDGRQRIILLSEKGKEVFATLERGSQNDMQKMLNHLTPDENTRLVSCMQTIENMLGGKQREMPPYLLRSHRAGDMSWIVHRQMVLYAREYGWNEEFETLAGDICMDFLRNYDAAHESCWMAEREGSIIGSVFVVRKSETTAQLRMLYVEPAARGLGVGTRLVDECIRFARQAGYREMMLWTQSVLLAARRIYQRAGFQRISQEPAHSFGTDLMSEIWQMNL